MIKSRKEILELNSTFSKFILDLQLSNKPEPFEEGDRVDSASFNLVGNDKGITILTNEIANKLTLEQNRQFEQNLDENPFSNSICLNFLESRLIISSKQKANDYLFDIASALEQIRVDLNESDLMVLAVENTPWLSQQNEYEPVKKALTYLKEKIDVDFSGGFLL
ncbi:MAG: hypothetical protein ACPGLV_11155 [Bacteroidia bacterium]